MWKQKIGISLGANYSKPIEEVIEMLARIGFDAISPTWRAEEELHRIAKLAKENDLSLQSLHAPFTKAAAMWSRDPAVFSPAKEELLKAVDLCRDCAIPVMVVHAWIGFDYTFCKDDLYFENFDALVQKAKQNGVQIAFENTEGEEYLFALMNRYKDEPTVGFCWDSGHEMCYNRSDDLLAMFGNRLLMTHLNDNLGVSRFDGSIFWTDDLHLLPYDGIADWHYNVDRLKKANRLAFLNFELNITSKPNRHENDMYTAMPLEQYFTLAYMRACRIAHRYAN